jgi:hypothetical protein
LFAPSQKASVAQAVGIEADAVEAEEHVEADVEAEALVVVMAAAAYDAVEPYKQAEVAHLMASALAVAEAEVGDEVVMGEHDAVAEEVVGEAVVVGDDARVGLGEAVVGALAAPMGLAGEEQMEAVRVRDTGLIDDVVGALWEEGEEVHASACIGNKLHSLYGSRPEQSAGAFVHGWVEEGPAETDEWVGLACQREFDDRDWTLVAAGTRVGKTHIAEVDRMSAVSRRVVSKIMRYKINFRRTRMRCADITRCAHICRGCPRAFWLVWRMRRLFITKGTDIDRTWNRGNLGRQWNARMDIATIVMF